MISLRDLLKLEPLVKESITKAADDCHVNYHRSILCIKGA